MKKIKILHVIPTLLVGGAEMLLKDLAIHLNQEGNFEIELFIFDPSSSPIMDEAVSSKLVMYFGKGQPYYSLQNVLQLYRHLKNFKYDIVHAHLTPAQISTALVSLFLARKPKFITSEHSMHNKRRTSLFKYFDRWMYNRFTKIICVSEYVKRSLNIWLPDTQEKTLVIYNGIDINKFKLKDKLERLNRLDASKFIIVCVGRLVLEKNQDILIEAIKTIPEAHLFFIGDGPRRNLLFNKAKHLGVDNRVYFLGTCSNIPSLLSKADVYVQPSIWEGFGIATVEAMASGLPVLVSDIPVLKDIVGDAGILFKHSDCKELFSILQDLQKNNHLRNQFAEKSRQRGQFFSLEKTIYNHATLYNALLFETPLKKLVSKS